MCFWICEVYYSQINEPSVAADGSLFTTRRMLLPSIGAQHHKKACTGRFLRRLCLFLIFHKGSQIAHRADPLQVVIRPFDAEFLL